MPVNHTQTSAAIVLAIVLLVPALIVGYIVTYIYFNFVLSNLEDSIFDWITGGWFRKIMYAILPNVLHGAVGGGLSVWICGKVLKKANFNVAAYAIAAILIAFLIFFLYLTFKSGFEVSIFNTRYDYGLVESISNTAGIIIGLFIAAAIVAEEQNKAAVQTSNQLHE